MYHAIKFCTVLVVCNVSAIGLSQKEAVVPPRIVSTVPSISATDVDPKMTTISVTFDQDMGSGFSWTGGGPHYPAADGKPVWIDKRTCAMPVKLDEGKLYRVGINSDSFNNFRSVTGVPATPAELFFATKGASKETLAMMSKPAVKSLDPPNGATGVDPAITQISITFDQPMGDGMSWCGGGPEFPGGEGQITWNADHTVCTKPVKLQAGHTYSLGVNCPSFKNFKNTGGISVDPVKWTFTTK